MNKKLFLLDAMALIYRAYYAMIRSPRFTSKGINTSATFGFTNTLIEILKNEKPTHIAVSFDTGAPTLRHAEYDDYKANRESTPEDIINAIPYIQKILEALNIPVIVKDGYEADDIIGTIAKKAEIEGFQVYMMTSDKDYGQLVSENIFIYKPGKFGQKAEIIGVEEVCKKYEIENPEQLIDILGLWGDASDNIPGVPQVGEVKAKRLIQQFQSIENLYNKIHQVDNEKLRQNLIECQDKAMLSKSLATIILDVPVEFCFGDMILKTPHSEKLRAIFNELEFHSLGNRVFGEMKVEKKTSDTATPDLFKPTEKEIEPEQTSAFATFNSQSHNFLPFLKIDQIAAEMDVEKALFFDWILVNEKIAGFAIASSTVVKYHLLEKEHRYYLPILKTIFETPRTIVTYQVKSNYKYLKALNIEPVVTFFDLQIAHYLLQPEYTHQLENLTESYLQYKLMPVEQKPDLQEIIDRFCERVEIYLQLYPLLKEELEKYALTSLMQNLEMPLAEVLADMEYTGIKLDKSILTKNAIALKEELQQLENTVFELAGTTFNLASPKQLGEVLFEKLQIITNAKLTKTKQYQTGEEVLVKLINKHPVVQHILDWRTLSKLKTTYIDALPQLVNPKTERIHSSFQQTVTSTGRLSSTNPNLQNIPIRTERGKDIRKAFVASDDNHLILSADYSQVELRVVAAASEDRNMIESFENKQDIHATTASLVYHVPISEITSQQRRYAKTVNFGILYGISAFGLAERLHIPQSEARMLISNYNDTFPKINQYMEGLIEFARENGYVETILGRRRYIRDIRSGNSILRKAAERNAINAPIQGTAADIIKIAMINIYKELKNKRLKSKLILQVHDELVFEIPQNELSVMLELIPRLMNSAMTLVVPLEVDISYGKSWYDAH